jgi:DNA-binding LacI/PurR family transcriptional regulator
VIATQNTIARKLGISIATVSRALRNDPRISAVMKERVQVTAAEIGYRPNPLVTALMERVRSAKKLEFQGKIAVIIDGSYRSDWHSSNPTHVLTYNGAKRTAAKFGYDLENFFLRDYDSKGRRLSQVLCARGIQGLYLAPAHKKIRVSLEWERFSSVTSGYCLIEPIIHRVCFGIYNATKIVCRNLEDRGYKRLGFHLHEEHDQITDHRYRSAYLLFQDLLPIDRRIPICITEKNDKGKFLRWLDREKPDAVVSGYAGVIDWIRQAGLKCPDDVGYADLDWVPRRRGIAGVYHNPELMGEAVVDTIIAQINRNERGIPRHPRRTLIDGVWVEGSTIRPSDSGIESVPLVTL